MVVTVVWTTGPDCIKGFRFMFEPNIWVWTWKWHQKYCINHWTLKCGSTWTTFWPWYVTPKCGVYTWCWTIFFQIQLYSNVDCSCKLNLPGCVSHVCQASHMMTMSFIYFHHKRAPIFGSKKGSNTQIFGSSELDPKNVPMTLILFIQYFWRKISLIWIFGSFEPHFEIIDSIRPRC